MHPLFAYKLDILEKINKFLETHNLTCLNKEEIKNLNRTITNKNIESIITNLSINESSAPDSFTSKFYKYIFIFTFWKKKIGKYCCCFYGSTRSFQLVVIILLFYCPSGLSLSIAMASSHFHISLYLKYAIIFTQLSSS